MKTMRTMCLFLFVLTFAPGIWAQCADMCSIPQPSECLSCHLMCGPAGNYVAYSSTEDCKNCGDCGNKYWGCGPCGADPSPYINAILATQRPNPKGAVPTGLTQKGLQAKMLSQAATMFGFSLLPMQTISTERRDPLMASHQKAVLAALENGPVCKRVDMGRVIAYLKLRDTKRVVTTLAMARN